MSIVVSRLEVQVARPIDALQHVPQERGDVVDVELRIVGLVDDQQVLGQRQLPLAEDRVGLRQQLLRPLRFGERPVALAADRQQQRMHAGRIDRVHAVHAGQHGGNHRPGQLVDQLAEDRVFLRRPADDRERPDRIVAMIDLLDAQHRESRAPGCSSPGDRRTALRAAACLGSTVPLMQKSASAWIGRPSPRRSMRMRRPPSAPANVSSVIPSGSGITAASVIAGGPPTKTFTRNGSPRANRRRVMHADAAMDLVVQADLAVRLVLAAGKLHAVHAQVRVPPARARGRPRCRPAAA